MNWEVTFTITVKVQVSEHDGPRAAIDEAWYNIWLNSGVGTPPASAEGRHVQVEAKPCA